MIDRIVNNWARIVLVMCSVFLTIEALVLAGPRLKIIMLLVAVALMIASMTVRGEELLGGDDE